MSQVLYVAKSGSDEADGSENNPLLTINAAAVRAQPGDTVVVNEGVYREWVKPPRGGLSNSRRICFRAQEGHKVVLKGSERVTSWQHVEKGVWQATIENSVFEGFNPFLEEVSGDWALYSPGDPRAHLGEVYLNGMSFYEVHSLREVMEAEPRESVVDHWTGTSWPVPDVEQTGHVWFARVDKETTTIWANFHQADPRQELVEINVRRSIFSPTRSHVDYLTVSGFEMAHAATPWAPPTSEQVGAVGPGWSKGWVIENNTIHDVKCAAISLGKDLSTGDNFASVRGDKPGYQYQLETVFQARRLGWDREHIGSHIVRNNTIYNCGQNGIVGHLGCIFSTITGNNIFRIGVKREFYGHEIGGIKLHAAIDVVIEGNRIHDCSLGLWLDWQTQGTRVTRNIFFDNARDMFVEVSHGPYVVDHNVFASPASIENLSQGGAYLNNLICGTLRVESVMERPTPYHLPHSTQVAGVGAIYAGDDRYIGNIFLGDNAKTPYSDEAEVDPIYSYGTDIYDGYPASMGEYLQAVAASEGGDHGKFLGVKQPVYIADNAYLGVAKPYQREDNPTEFPGVTAKASVVEVGGAGYLQLELPAEFGPESREVVTASDLPRVRMADADFESPDGSRLAADVDLVGKKKDIEAQYAPGPIADVGGGTSKIRLW